MGTVNFLESIRACDSVGSVVNVTTDKVYENNEWVWGYRENDRLNGHDPYSNSKSCSELVTDSYRKAFFSCRDIAISTCRVGNVIGGGDFACAFPTTVTPILQYGAVPVFVDVTIPQYNIDVSMMEEALSDKTKAVMVAHTLGNPFDIKSVKTFCDKHNLWLIEDNCDALGSRYTLDSILYSCHPRSKKHLEKSGFQLDKRIIQHEPLGFHDYNCLQINAFCVVSDSRTLPEESSYFISAGHPFPAVSIRTSTERPEALDKGCFIIAGIDERSLLQAVDTAVEMHRNGDYGIPVPDYTDIDVSNKVVKIVQSYMGIVNKMVWRKSCY